MSRIKTVDLFGRRIPEFADHRMMLFHNCLKKVPSPISPFSHPGAGLVASQWRIQSPLKRDNRGEGR